MNTDTITQKSSYFIKIKQKKINKLSSVYCSQTNNKLNFETDKR